MRGATQCASQSMDGFTIRPSGLSLPVEGKRQIDTAAKHKQAFDQSISIQVQSQKLMVV